MVICTCWLQTQGTSTVRWFWAEALWDRALIYQMVIRLQQDSKMAICICGCWINILREYKRNIALVSCHWIPLLILFLASSPPRDCAICDWSSGSTKQSKDKPNDRQKCDACFFKPNTDVGSRMTASPLARDSEHWKSLSSMMRNIRKSTDYCVAKEQTIAWLRTASRMIASQFLLLSIPLQIAVTSYLIICM